MNEITLALGGGGVRGIAHIGVLRVLEREGFKIEAVAGTSAGGLVGALYAAGFKPEQIQALVDRIPQPTFFSRAARDEPSLLGLEGLNEVLLEKIAGRSFESLDILFACTAVDLNTSQEVILAHGDLIDSIMATIAVPGIFPPRVMGDALLVDGGVLDPVPVALARWLAPTLPVIAVCLQPPPDKWALYPPQANLPNISALPRPLVDRLSKLRISQALNIFAECLEISSRMLAELRMQHDRPEIIIRPKVDQYGLLDQVNPGDLIRAGEEAAVQQITAIKEALSWSNQMGRFFRKANPPGTILKAEQE